MTRNKYITNNGTELVMTEDQATVYRKINDLQLIEINIENVEEIKDPAKKAPKFSKVADMNKEIIVMDTEPIIDKIQELHDSLDPALKSK